MLIKLIQCHVYPDMNLRFAQGQAKWRALRALAGFHGQLGGWSRDDPSLAVILGLWAGRDDYDAFMNEAHDAIAGAADQSGAYDAERSSTSLWIPAAISSPLEGTQLTAILAEIEELWLTRLPAPRTHPQFIAAQLALEQGLEPDAPRLSARLRTRPRFSAILQPPLTITGDAGAADRDLLKLHFWDEKVHLETSELRDWTRIRLDPAWTVEAG